MPCASFMIVSIGTNEAKVESTVSEFCQISRKKSVFEGMKGVVTEGNVPGKVVLDGARYLR